MWFAEGEFDTLTLMQYGLMAVGIHGAAHVPKTEGEGAELKIKYNKGFAYDWKFLFDGTLCIVAFDNDEAGRKFGRMLAAALGGVVFDEWPDYDDAPTDFNDWHRDDPVGMANTLNRFRDRVRSERGMEAI